MVLEVMGRHTGWIAVVSGIAGGADVILIPEHPVSIEDTCKEIQQPARPRQGLLDRGRLARATSSRAAATRAGEVDQFGHTRLSERGVGARVAQRDRAAHGLRDARHRARARPARRLPHPARPRARDALRAEGGRPRPRGPLRPHGRAARRQHRRRLARGGDRRAEDRAPRTGTKWRAPSSARACRPRPRARSGRARPWPRRRRASASARCRRSGPRTDSPRRAASTRSATAPVTTT